MKYSILFFIIMYSGADVLTVNVPAPDYQIIDNEIIIEKAHYLHPAGAPDLAGKKVTIALPPGALIEKVVFSGMRSELGEFTVSPVLPAFPLSGDDAQEKIWTVYNQQIETFYSQKSIYPDVYGAVLGKGGLRKYTLVDVVCYHFAYNASTHKLYCSPRVTVQINYKMSSPDSPRARFYDAIVDDITFDQHAEEIIYNWEEAKNWYHTDSPKRANGYYIIISQALQSSVNALVTHRQNQGYDVTIVTKEYINANVAGNDLQQKIRNFLRDNLADIEYVLLVGFFSDLPWRMVVPWNDDPDSPYDDLNISPLPSDLYYAELSEHDTLSWNLDQDEYYGEVYDSLGVPDGDDAPDYHADVHVGRIPYSTESIIQSICTKTVTFDTDSDFSYKSASLLAGGMIFFENQNYSGYPRVDGADDMEQLMNDSITPRNNAYYLYEKAGLRSCPYPCTDSLTRSNMISYWDQRGVVYEFNHGAPSGYYRTIWVWDDGDSVPEYNEMQSILCLNSSDVYQLDNQHPATTFLRSCSCGRPEQNSLGQMLLQYGSSAVICNSRSGWVSLANRGGVVYHFLDRLMKDTLSSRGVVGAAYDLARTDFMDSCMFWLPAYHHNLYADPALRQFGRLTGVLEQKQALNISTFSVHPNPVVHECHVRYSVPITAEVRISLFDVAGRNLIDVREGEQSAGVYTEVIDMSLLPQGIYFIQVTSGLRDQTRKVVYVK